MRKFSTYNKFFLLLLIMAASAWGGLYAQDCNGTPTAGSVSASTPQVCPGNGSTVILSLSGESSATGISLQWQSSPDNLTWTNIAGSTTGTYTYTVPDGFTGMYFRVAVTCNNSNQTAYTSGVQITLPLLAGYAQLPFNEGFEGDWIHICFDGQLPQPTSGLNWNNLPASTNNSWRRDDEGAEANWSQPDYGAYTPPGGQGSQHSARFHSTYATSNGMMDLYVNCNTTLATKKLSFDYINPDGTDSLEVLLSTDGGVTFKRLYGVYTSAGWANKSIIFSSMSATTVIRFMGVADNGNTDIGMDNVNVQEVVACTGIPPVAKAVTDNSSICHGSQFTLSASEAAYVAGYAYQWESSANGTSGWATISNATDSALTITESAKTYYRAVVTCTLSGDSSFSNTVAVNIPSPMAGTYTINSAAATGGGNFKSFTDAASALQCSGVAGPVVFNVKPGSGPYNEQVLLDSIIGTSAANTVTFKGNGNTIKFSSASQGMGVVMINGSSYITIDSLVIDASPAAADTATHYGFGVVLQNQANNNTINGCRIITDSLTANDVLPASYAGIVLDGTGSYTTISNNSISGGYAGIQAQSGGTGNKITNNSIQQFRNVGITFQFVGNPEDSLLIQNNFISSPHRANGNAPAGINVFGGSNLVISKNRVYSMYSPGYVLGIGVFAINEMPSSVSSVTNNLIYNINGLQGATGIVSASYNNMQIAFNTISVVDSAMPAGSTIEGIFIGGGNTSNVAIEDNLVSINAKGSSSNHGINLSTAIQPGFILDYNDYFLSGNANNAIGFIPPVASTTLAGWQQATSLEAHSVTINPGFEDTARGDYKPTSTDLDNRGTPIAGITSDILNITRNTVTPDIGAYEFKACVPIRGVYTIDAGAAPGTARTFLSFNDAYEALRCGIDSAVIFNVKSGSGPYNEQLNMEYITGSSALNTVTFNGNGETIRFSSKDQTHKAVVEFNGTQHVALDSLVIDATPPVGQSQPYWGYWGVGVQMFNNAGYNTIHACNIITDSIVADDPGGFNFEYTYTGIALIGNSQTDSVYVNHTMFDHNTITGGYCGIGLDGIIQSDTFVNNTVRKFFEYGISLHNYYVANEFYSDSILVQGNDVYSITQGLTGIEVLDANNVTIEKNKVHNMNWFGCSGIIVDALNNIPGSKVYVVNNLVHDLGYDSTASTPTNYAYGIINYCEGAVFIEHNTVDIHNSAKTGTTTINGIMSYVITRTGEDGHSVIENNLVNIDGSGTSLAACMFFVSQAPANQTYTFNYNNYYTGSDTNNAVGILGGTYIKQLSDWTAQTGQDSNSVNINAMFADTANGNYKPTNYKFDNLGTPLGVLNDIVDTIRSTTHPDIGCYEFKACAPKFAGFSISTQLACTEVPVSFAATDTTFNYHTVDDWAWDFGNGTSSSLQNPVATFNTAGTFNIQLTENTQDGCVDDTTKTITVVDCFKQLFIPNAFTPNGDGLNDQLRVYGNGIQQIKFMVFNQWGQKLFETDSQSDGWDGTQNGKMQPSGVYMYVCEVTMNDGRKTIKKGSVNLIR